MPAVILILYFAILFTNINWANKYISSSFWRTLFIIGSFIPGLQQAILGVLFIVRLSKG